MLSRKIVLFVVLILQFVLGGKPDWIKSRPVTSDYYIGIGIASKSDGLSSDQLATVAKERALNDLISEISVKIKGEGIVDAEAVGDSLQERYYEQIQLETKADLTGHEFVGEYKKGKVHYVYYRLKKSRWAKIENERLKKAISLCKRHMENGDRFYKEVDLISSIDELVRAYNVLLPVLYLNPRTTINGKEVILSSLVKEKVTTVARSISFDHTTPVYNGVRKLYGPKSGRLFIKNNDNLITQFPLLIGDAEMTSLKEGIFLTTDIIGDEDTVSVPVEINIDALSPLCEKSAVVRSWITTIQWPTSELLYIFRKPAVLIETSEMALDMELDNVALKPILEEHFVSKGYALKQRIGHAEIVLSFKSNTRTISAFSSLFFVYLDVTAEVRDKDGKKLYSKKFKPIKGGGLDYDQASVKAYEKASPFIAKEILNWCQDNL